MKKFRKVICLVIALVLSVSALAGCGQGETNEEIAVLELWTGESHAKAVMNKLFEEFNNTIGKEKGIKLVNVVKDNLGQAITVAFESEQEPAFFMAGSISEFSEKDYIVPINSLKNSENVINRAKDAGLLVEYTHTYNDNVYCIPFMASAMGLIYNKDMFKEAGIVDENGEALAPKTMAEVREYAKILTDAEKKRYGFVFPLKWSSVFNSEMIMPAGPSTGYVDGYNPETGEFDFSVMKETLETILAINNDGSCMPGAEGIDNDTARARFANGDIGMKFGAYWDVGVYTTQFKAKCDWGVAPIPVVDYNNRYKQTFGVNSGYRISKSAVEKYGEEKIMTAYNWMYSDKVLSELYKSGCYLSCYSDIIEKTDITDESLKNWKVFADILVDSVFAPQIAKTEVSGMASLSDNFLNQVWYGKMDLDEALALETKNKNEGAKKYREMHPDYDAKSILVENWFETAKVKN